MNPPSFLLANRSFRIEVSGADLPEIGSYEKHFPPLGSLRMEPPQGGSPIRFVSDVRTEFTSVLTASVPDDLSALPDATAVRISDCLFPDACVLSRKIETTVPLSFRIGTANGVQTDYPAVFSMRDGTVRGVLLTRETAQTDGVRDPLLDPCLLFLASGSASFADDGRRIVCQPGTGWILLIASPVGKLRPLLPHAMDAAWVPLPDRPGENRLTGMIRRAESGISVPYSGSGLLPGALLHLSALHTDSGSYAECSFAGWCRSESLARCIIPLLRLGKEKEAQAILSFFIRVLRQNPVLPPFLTLTGNPLSPSSRTNAAAQASAALLGALSDTVFLTNDPKPLAEFSPYLPELFRVLSLTLCGMTWGFSEEDPLLYSGLLPKEARLYGSSISTLRVIHACRRFEEAKKHYPGVCPDSAIIGRTLRLTHEAGKQWEARFLSEGGIMLCDPTRIRQSKRPASLYGVCDGCRGKRYAGIGSVCGSGLPSLPLTLLNRSGENYLCLSCQTAGEAVPAERRSPNAGADPVITAEAALLLRKWKSDLLRPAEIEHYAGSALTSPETCGIRELTLLVDSESDSERRADYAKWLEKRLSGRLMLLRPFEIAEACAALAEWEKQKGRV